MQPLEYTSELTFRDGYIPATEWLTYEEHAAEYRAALAALKLELPPGVAIAPDPAPEPSPGSLYERGSGEVSIVLAWLKSVQVAAVQAHRAGTFSEAQRWVDVAAEFVNTETFAKYNDPNVPISWFDDVVVRARAGDFSTMAQNAEV